jgi:hypothetical protein
MELVSYLATEKIAAMRSLLYLAISLRYLNDRWKQAREICKENICILHISKHLTYLHLRTVPEM